MCRGAFMKDNDKGHSKHIGRMLDTIACCKEGFKY